MGEVELLDKLQTELEIPVGDYGKYRQEVEKVLADVKKRNIIFDEDAKLAFAAHVISLMMRLEKNEKVADLDEDVIAEIKPSAMQTSKEILSDIEKKFGELSRSEIVLVAIHIQTTLEKGGIE